MEILLAFVIGYTVGARAGNEGFSEVLEAARAVRKSEEFAALMDALRAHTAATLHQLADVLSNPHEPVNPERLVERVRSLIGSVTPGAQASAS